MAIATEYVLLRQNERDDSWDAVVVDQKGADGPHALRRFLTSGDPRAKEGRWVAIPNSFWIGYQANVRQIAEVDLETEYLV